VTGRRLSLLAAILITPGLASTAGALPPQERPPQQQPSETPGGCGNLSSDGSRDVRVAWGEASWTRSCFFFSGPGELGRDDQYGSSARWTRQGNRVRLAFGSAVFEGQVSGDRVRLTRRSEHSYGSTWTATEVIEGRVATGQGGPACQFLQASYGYSECDTANSHQCPSVCRIEAPLSVQ